VIKGGEVIDTKYDPNGSTRSHGRRQRGARAGNDAL